MGWNKVENNLDQIHCSMNQIVLRRRANISTAKMYIQDGLTAMWDGIENVGWGLHNSNTKVWKELTGSGLDFNILQDDVSWGSNCLITSKENYPAALCNNPIDKQSYITQEIVFHVLDDNRDGTASRTIIFNSGLWYESSNYKLSLRCLAYNRTQTANSGWMLKTSEGILTSINTCPKIPISISTIYLPTTDNLSHQADVVKVRLNGSNKNTSHFDGIASNLFGVGFTSAKIKIYAIRIYNRRLSDAEMAYNLQLDRKRFGLEL